MDYLRYVSSKKAYKTKIKNKRSEDRGKRKNVRFIRGLYYICMRILMVAVLIMWFVSAVKLVVKTLDSRSTKSSEVSMVNAFVKTGIKDAKASVRADGYMGRVCITDNGKKLILSELAEYMDLRNYDIDIIEDSSQRTVLLRQTSKYGDITMKITENVGDKDKNSLNKADTYISTEVVLEERIENIFQIKAIMERAFEKLNQEVNVGVAFLGNVDGELDIDTRNALSKQFLDNISAKWITASQDYDGYVVYGYTDEVKECVSFGKSKINVAINMYYDENDKKTWISFTSPINNVDF